MPSTVTTNVLLVASTAKLFAKLMVGVAPTATPGVDEIPRVAMLDFSTDEFEKPSNDVAVAFALLMDILDWSPVAPERIVNILLALSYSTFMPKRCSDAGLIRAPFGTALKPVKPPSANAVEAIGNPSTSFLTVPPDLTVIVLVVSVNLKLCVE